MGYEIRNLSTGKRLYFSQKAAEMLLNREILDELEGVIKMKGHCKGCRNYRPDNQEMKSPGRNVIVGDFCLKFKWNLGRVKTWVQKHSSGMKKAVTYPPMTKLPEGCYER